MNFYKLQLSNKTDIEIDQDDFNKFATNAPSGNFIKLKQGLINPSFVVAIVPIEKKVDRKIEGHLDEERGVFVIEADRDTEPEIADGFSDRKLLNKSIE